MTSTNKPERDWHDPPTLAVIEGLNPSVMESQHHGEGNFNPKLVPRGYKLIIIGLTYLFMGAATGVGFFFNLSADALLVSAILAGIIITGYGVYTYRKDTKLNVRE